MYEPTHTGQNIRECPTRNAIAKPFYDTDSFLLLRQTNPPPSPHLSSRFFAPLPEYTSIAIKSMSAAETGKCHLWQYFKSDVVDIIKRIHMY